MMWQGVTNMCQDDAVVFTPKNQVFLFTQVCRYLTQIMAEL